LKTTRPISSPAGKSRTPPNCFRALQNNFQQLGRLRYRQRGPRQPPRIAATTAGGMNRVSCRVSAHSFAIRTPQPPLSLLVAIWVSRLPKRGSITLAAKVITCFYAFLARVLVVPHQPDKHIECMKACKVVVSDVRFVP
jgi:hypothetical protein